MAASSLRRQHEQPGDEDRLGDLAFLVGGRLEGLAGRVGEAIQIQAVIPIGAADQRQTVRPQSLERIAGGCAADARTAVARCRAGCRRARVSSRMSPIAGLFEVGRNPDDQPERIIVEVAAHVVVAPLGQRLVLVIGAAGRAVAWRPGRGCAPGRAPASICTNPSRSWLESRKPKPAPDARFVERSRARHVERRHALVSVPDIDHAVRVLIRRLHLRIAQQAIPICLQRVEAASPWPVAGTWR